MLSEILAYSRQRTECANNYLMPSVDKVAELLKEFEKTAPKEYFQLFEKREKKKKGEFLLQEGELATQFWFMEEGIARQYFHKDGQEVTNDLFFPCEFVDAYATSMLGLPSRVNIRLVTDAVVRGIDYVTLAEMEIRYPILGMAERLVIACDVLWLEERLHDVQHHTATERYNKLIEKQPQLIKKVSLSYIASYLNISLETLSRVRATLKTKTK
jgi:CRP-like cAMP-binding protein